MLVMNYLFIPLYIPSYHLMFEVFNRDRLFPPNQPPTPKYSPKTVCLVKFTPTHIDCIKTGTTLVLPEYAILFREAHVCLIPSLVIDKDNVYGFMVEDLTPSLVQYTVIKELGVCHCDEMTLSSRMNELFNLYGSYHHIWWNSDGFLRDYIYSILGEQTIDMLITEPTSVFATMVNHYYHPQNKEPIGIPIETVEMSRKAILEVAISRLPKDKGSCTIL